jgi:SAM-dependent methyltransferase
LDLKVPIVASHASDYAGIRELEAAERNLKRYIRRKCNFVMRFLEGRTVLEVGCGIGTFTRFLSERGYKVVAIDTSSECLREAEKRGVSASFLQVDICDIDGQGELHNMFDSVVMVTVLEHVKDDLKALVNASWLLRSGGCLVLLVPAFGCLFSDFDRLIGHHRRYSKSELGLKVTNAGFKIEFSRYYDFLGLVGWLVKCRLMRSTRLIQDLEEPIFDKAYDRWLSLEDHIVVPLGVNLLVKLRKCG